MYLHVGNNRNIRKSSVIGIFDMDPNEPGACLILLEIDGLLAENAEIALETMVGYWKDN